MLYDDTLYFWSYNDWNLSKNSIPRFVKKSAGASKWFSVYANNAYAATLLESSNNIFDSIHLENHFIISNTYQ